MNIENNRRIIGFIFLVIAVSFANSIMGEMSAVIIKQFFGNENQIILAISFLIISLISFGALFYLLTRRVGKIIGTSVITRNSLDDRNIKYLIMGYSPLPEEDISKTVDAMKNELVILGVDVVAGDRNSYEKATTDLASAERSALPKQNKWQQNLRSAWAHKDYLEQILVLNPDKDQFEHIQHYLSHAFSIINRKITIRLITYSNTNGMPFKTINDETAEWIEPNYENYVYVYRGMRRGLNMIAGESDELDREICIDATPGQKPFSIAAAMITLKRKLVYSYVNNQGKLKYYDIDFFFGREST